MKEADKKPLGYIVVNVDGTPGVRSIWGTYTSLEIAKREAEALIIDFVEDGNFEKNCSYEDLCKLGAGILNDWYESDCDLSSDADSAIAIDWKYTPEDDAESMIVIPVPAISNPSSLSGRLAKSLEKIEHCAIAARANIRENVQSDLDLENVFPSLRKEVDGLLDLLNSIEKDLS